MYGSTNLFVYYENPPAFKNQLIFFFYIHLLHLIYAFCLFLNINVTPNPNPRSVSCSRVYLGGF